MLVLYIVLIIACSIIVRKKMVNFKTIYISFLQLIPYFFYIGITTMIYLITYINLNPKIDERNLNPLYGFIPLITSIYTSPIIFLLLVYFNEKINFKKLNLYLVMILLIPCPLLFYNKSNLHMIYKNEEFEKMEDYIIINNIQYKIFNNKVYILDNNKIKEVESLNIKDLELENNIIYIKENDGYTILCDYTVCNHIIVDDKVLRINSDFNKNYEVYYKSNFFEETQLIKDLYYLKQSFDSLSLYKKSKLNLFKKEKDYDLREIINNFYKNIINIHWKTDSFVLTLQEYEIEVKAELDEELNIILKEVEK